MVLVSVIPKNADVREPLYTLKWIDVKFAWINSPGRVLRLKEMLISIKYIATYVWN